MGVLGGQFSGAFQRVGLCVDMTVLYLCIKTCSAGAWLVALTS